jgi:adenylate cyclase
MQQGLQRLLYLFEDCVLDVDRRELRRGTDLVAVQPQVFDLLVYLVVNRDRVISREDLLASVWQGRIVSESALDSRINAARSAIGDSGQEQRLIKTLPRKGIRFVGAVREELERERAVGANLSGAVADPARVAADKPSVAVLPFANMSADPDQEYFTDGITEDIITELTRFSDLLVIARNSCFQYKGKAIDVRQIGRELGVRYVVEGSIRRDVNRIRVTAQLVETETGTHRWGERYDRELKDVFGLQDEITHTIVAVVASHVNRAEGERTLLKPPATWAAYDYYLRAVECYRTFYRPVRIEAIHETRAWLDQCLTIDPNYARGYVLRSTTLTSTYAIPLNDDYYDPSILDQALQAATKAVELDPLLPQAHAQLGYVLAFMGTHEAAIAEFEQAFALNPNFTDWRVIVALVWAGKAEKAIEVGRAHCRLDPHAYAIAQGYWGLAHLVLKRHEDALPLLREFVARSVNHLMGRVWLASLYGHLGRLEEAQVQNREILRIYPGWTIEDHQRRRAPYWCAEYAAHVEDGLRKARLGDQ